MPGRRPGRGCAVFGGERQARRHWREALSLYTELGAPEAEEVRAKLAADTHAHR